MSAQLYCVRCIRNHGWPNNIIVFISSGSVFSYISEISCKELLSLLLLKAVN